MNDMKTQKKLIALALGAVTEMDYLYAGADKGIETEMQGKDNGDTIFYRVTQLGDPTFVEDIDSADYEEGGDLALTATDIKQVTVAVKMNSSSVMYKIKAFERLVTSLTEEIARGKIGAKLGQKAVGKIIEKDIASIGNVFVCGENNAFEVFQKAGAFLKGRVQGNLFGWMDWNIWGELTGKGQQAVPCALCDTPFGKNLKGSWTLIDQLRVSQDIKEFTAPAQPTWSNITGKVEGNAIKLKASSAATIKKGDLFTIAGIYSKDVNDVATNKLYVFRAGKDISVGTSDTDVTESLANFQYGVEATATGWVAPEAVTAGAVKGLLTAGKTYAACIIRADGAQAFGMIKNCDCEGAKYQKSEFGGLTVHENSGEVIKTLSTEKRFDMIFASKLVEPRAAALVLYPLS